MRIFSRSWQAQLAVSLVSLAVPGAAWAGFITVIPGPGVSDDGRRYEGGSPVGMNNAGAVVSYAFPHGPGPQTWGSRALRWTSTSSDNAELMHIGVDANGDTQILPASINAGGLVAGAATLYDSAHTRLGDRAVRWDAAGTPTVLDPIDVLPSGVSNARARAMNAGGTVVGLGQRYISNVFKGERPVRWDASGSAATVLGTLSADSTEHYAAAWGTNDAGTVVGTSDKYSGATFVGARAVRWAPGSTVPIELGTLNPTLPGYDVAVAAIINASGTTFGSSHHFGAAGEDFGGRVVRWDSGDTVAHALQNFGTDSLGFAGMGIGDANDAGQSVGAVTRYDSNGNSLGLRPVRWDASGAATELASLSFGPNGHANGSALAINAGGDAVGYGFFGIGADGMGGVTHAMYWDADGWAVDLNTVIDPSSGWTLLDAATQINDLGWIAGTGFYDPDGPGGQAAYVRHFMITQVPEPGGMGLALAASLGMRRWRRQARRAEHAAVRVG